MWGQTREGGVVPPSHWDVASGPVAHQVARRVRRMDSSKASCVPHRVKRSRWGTIHSTRSRSAWVRSNPLGALTEARNCMEYTSRDVKHRGMVEKAREASLAFRLFT